MVWPQEFSKDLVTGLARLNKEQIGPPTQITYYSRFPGQEDYKYEHKSTKALKSYSDPGASESHHISEIIKYSEWEKDSRHLDSLLQPGLEPITESCKEANYTDKVDVITTRGTLIDLAVRKEGRYDVSFVDGTLNILRRSFTSKMETKTVGTIPSTYYGDCFETLCTEKPSEPYAEFFSIVSRKIGGLNVVMSAEVDCSLGAEPNLDCYKELKTVTKSAVLKELHWAERGFMQSYLVGISKLQIGHRDPGKNCFSKVVETPIWQLVSDEAKRYRNRYVPVEKMRRVYTVLV